MIYLRPKVFYPCVILLAVVELSLLFRTQSVPAVVAAFVAWFAGVWIGMYVRERQILRQVDKLL